MIVVLPGFIVIEGVDHVIRPIRVLLRKDTNRMAGYKILKVIWSKN
jgi:hypothetical protein